MLTDQANYQWWLIQMWIPNYFYLFGFFKNSSMVCFGASQRTFPVPQRSQDVLGKKTQWQNVNILMFSQASSDHCPFFCAETFRIPALARGHTHRRTLSKEAPLTLRNPVSCADSGKKKERFLAWWVCPKFIISLPSEIWRVSEVHPGALRKKPLLIIINYLPPSHTSEQLHLSKPPLTWKQHMKI